MFREKLKRPEFGHSETGMAKRAANVKVASLE